MVRVVNVERALSFCRCKGEGSLIVDIIDTILPGNQGSWRISFAPGRPNQVEKTGNFPDITLPISAFSTLLCTLVNPPDGYEVCCKMDVAYGTIVVYTGKPESVCIEPWCGIPDSIHNGRMVEWIPAGESRDYTLEYQLKGL
jgi:hypothetical protein